MQDFSSDLQLAIEAAKKAGEIIKAGYGNIQKIDNKDNGTIVTNVDKESEKAIINILQKKSNYAIYSEEIGNIKGKDGLWVIDPIDGTTNFARGIPLFCVSIALMKTTGTDSGQARMTREHTRPEIELGVIYNPVLDDLYFSEKEKGTYLNKKRIYVSKQQNLQRSVVFINSGYSLEDKDRYAQVTKKLVPSCTIRKFGTTALELCFVAKGSADAFMSSGDELYDYAAGLIIVEEAGGKITDWKENEWDNSNSFILASNGKIHRELLQNLQNIQQ
ncbi:MAG: inositol monophosphatase [Candidatus Levybacteria bacterium]|nr:inositol monophosphatase [Candidatus Levybacteria bacterium]